MGSVNEPLPSVIVLNKGRAAEDFLFGTDCCILHAGAFLPASDLKKQKTALILYTNRITS